MGKRRTKGEGTVYYDTSRDRWVGQVFLEGRRRKVSAKTKADATAKLGKMVHGDPNERHLDRRLTVAALLADWQSLHLDTKDRAPGTKEAHRWACSLLVDELGKVRVADLDARDIEKALWRLAERREKPLARASLVKVRSTLRQALRWAERRRLVAHNAAAVAELPTIAIGQRDRRALVQHEAEKLVAAMAEHPYRPIWLLSLRLGLRPGEAAAVCVDALDLESDPPTVAVIRAVRLERGRPMLVNELKTTRARRTLAMPPILVDELRPAADAVGEGLLVSAPNGAPVWPSTVRSELQKVARAAGIAPLSPNELRHTAATRMADFGIPPHGVADVLGHTSTRMVDAVYRHRPSVIRGADSS
ncbi:site-specific integrase [Iamia sp. SCSIO 61187]|uniref:tyrosine-type recombinase/integrase n=1 Tax=Iamia sp. SCSIO 61187 TaxID=2722752 RepID=UPI001C6332B0|nr:site-specific integrase [Iamia sp. SCSIO 61187]QYG93463.1 site-specific integrase [Iamia sp. SCSIO 61187]